MISKQSNYCDAMLCMQTAIAISDCQRHMALLIIVILLHCCYNLLSSHYEHHMFSIKYCIMNVNLKEDITNTVTFSIYN